MEQPKKAITRREALKHAATQARLAGLTYARNPIDGFIQRRPITQENRRIAVVFMVPDSRVHRITQHLLRKAIL